jgi:hypothetical protein
MIPKPWTDAAALPASARAPVQSGVAFLEHEVQRTAAAHLQGAGLRRRPSGFGWGFVRRARAGGWAKRSLRADISYRVLRRFLRNDAPLPIGARR